jgi:formate-dependent nitrite reductase membrane component NrfD
MKIFTLAVIFQLVLHANVGYDTINKTFTGGIEFATYFSAVSITVAVIGLIISTIIGIKVLKTSFKKL